MKNFTSIHDVNEPKNLISLAQKVQKNPLAFQHFGSGKTICLLFFNPSLRTRLSSQKAAQNLGMQVMVMNFGESGWSLEFEDGTTMDGGSQEHIKEAAQVVSQYCDILGVRTFAKLENRESDYAETVLQKFLEHATVPVISLESAIRHPLQSLADILSIEKSRQKERPKVVLTWAPHPKALPQAVANSFVEWVNNMPYELVVANPPGFDLAPEFTEGVRTTHNQTEALQDADFVYAKNWSALSPYGAIGSDHSNWIVDAPKMAFTRQGKFMHCLPVRRNVVVSDEILDGPNSLVIEQAQNRIYAMQAVLLQLLGHEA